MQRQLDLTTEQTSIIGGLSPRQNDGVELVLADGQTRFGYVERIGENGSFYTLAVAPGQYRTYVRNRIHTVRVAEVAANVKLAGGRNYRA